MGRVVEFVIQSGKVCGRIKIKRDTEAKDSGVTMNRQRRSSSILSAKFGTKGPDQTHRVFRKHTIIIKLNNIRRVGVWS